MTKLAVLVPKPRVNLTRFLGVFAPNSKFRVRVTPAKRGKGRERRQPTGDKWLDKTQAECHLSMAWIQRPKWVHSWQIRFKLDDLACQV